MCCASHSLRSCHLGVDPHAAETGALQLLFPFDASCFPKSSPGPQHRPLSNGLGAPQEFPLPTRRHVQADLPILSRSNFPVANVHGDLSAFHHSQWELDWCGGCRGFREPFTRFRASFRGEKNPRPFRATFLSSCACAQVRLRCSFIAIKESMASVSLRPSSPICVIQLVANVSSRGGQ